MSDCGHKTVFSPNDLLFYIQFFKKSGFGLVQMFYKGKFPFVALVKVELYWL